MTTETATELVSKLLNRATEVLTAYGRDLGNPQITVSCDDIIALCRRLRELELLDQRLGGADDDLMRHVAKYLGDWRGHGQAEKCEVQAKYLIDLIAKHLPAPAPAPPADLAEKVKLAEELIDDIEASYKVNGLWVGYQRPTASIVEKIARALVSLAKRTGGGESDEEMKLVPVEPTEQMIEGAKSAWWKPEYPNESEYLRTSYICMVHAAKTWPLKEKTK